MFAVHKESLISRLSILLALLVCAWSSNAQLSEFKSGPLIQDYGKHATVEGHSLTSSTVLKVAFDVAKGADGGKINRHFDSLARFLNMHVVNGLKPENIHLALVVHGKASIDLLQSSVYQNVHQTDNPNVDLLKQLMQHNVDVILCGQSARAYEIDKSQVVSGVRFELSAMTAHALLQQQGFTVNPF